MAFHFRSLPATVLASMCAASVGMLSACTQGEPLADGAAGSGSTGLEVIADGWLQAGAELPTTELNAVTPAELFGDPAAFDGQAVLVEGTITRVCQASGCWFSFQQGGEDLYVFLEDAEGEMFYVPKDIADRQVRLYGTFSAESDAGKHELVAGSVQIAQN